VREDTAFFHRTEIIDFHPDRRDGAVIAKMAMERDPHGRVG